MLTDAQKTALLANIQITPVALTLYTDGNLSGLADFYNEPAAPAFTVWKSSVSAEEIMRNGFDWTRVDNLAVGLARVWEWMFQFGTIDPSRANIRAGIEQVWKGTAPDLAVRAAVYVHCKRPASRIERLFATGTGSDAVPGTMVYEGPLNFGDLIGL